MSAERESFSLIFLVIKILMKTRHGLKLLFHEAIKNLFLLTENTLKKKKDLDELKQWFFAWVCPSEPRRNC